MAKKFTSEQQLNLAFGAILSAIVIILQFLGSFIKLGPFSVSLVLLPIIIGAATCNAAISTWLGTLFGIIVLVSGDAAAFLGINPVGTVVTVLAKGALAGLVAGVIYKALSKKNRFLAVICSAIACPVVNTGIFLLCCRLFFYDTITQWGVGAGFESTTAYMFLGLVGANFLFELGINVILSPIVVRIINASAKVISRRKSNKTKAI